MNSFLPFSVRAFWVALRSSFWFIPTLMAVGAFGLAILMIYLDRALDHELTEKYPTLLAANASGARSILSAIASSMITVAGVVFSVTIVALSLASNQYTPRILRNFMADTGNQVVMGAFVGVFVYSLVVLRAIRGGEESFIPSYALLVGITLAFVGIGFLIFFVHHISTMVQASTILANIHEETIGVVEHLYPARRRDHPPQKNIEFSPKVWRSSTVASDRSGYIQDVNEAGLMQWAERNQAVVEMLEGIGEFVAAGAPLLKIYSPVNAADAAPNDLVKCFGIARSRTIEQDPAFGVRQIVDVALKALSPGINDPTTAASCIDYLGAIIFDLAQRDIPPRQRCRSGRVLLVSCTPSFQSLVDLAFHEIRQHARNNVPIYVKLLAAIRKAASTQLASENAEILWEHVHLIVTMADSEIQSPADRCLINDALEETATAFAKDFQQSLLQGRSVNNV